MGILCSHVDKDHQVRNCYCELDSFNDEHVLKNCAVTKVWRDTINADDIFENGDGIKYKLQSFTTQSGVS